jgi:hypothetical protein
MIMMMSSVMSALIILLPFLTIAQRTRIRYQENYMVVSDRIQRKYPVNPI